MATNFSYSNHDLPIWKKKIQMDVLQVILIDFTISQLNWNGDLSWNMYGIVTSHVQK